MQGPLSPLPDSSRQNQARLPQKSIGVRRTYYFKAAAAGAPRVLCVLSSHRLVGGAGVSPRSQAARAGEGTPPPPPLTSLADAQTDPEKPRSKRKPGIAGRLSARAEKMFEITGRVTALRDQRGPGLRFADAETKVQMGGGGREAEIPFLCKSIQVFCFKYHHIK